jgi:hypothetical protein
MGGSVLCCAAEIVASKPLSGARATNLKEFHRRVVYFERGDLSLRDKVRWFSLRGVGLLLAGIEVSSVFVLGQVHLAAKNGALAVVIGDNTGRCQNHEFTQVTVVVVHPVAQLMCISVMVALVVGVCSWRRQA